MPLEFFYQRKKKCGNASEYCQPCKECTAIKAKERYPKKRESFLKSKYNLETSDYLDLYKTQDGKCGICKENMLTVNIDHCHTTNKVRGLLCPECNRGLGLFYDNPERLLSAVEYLKK